MKSADDGDFRERGFCPTSNFFFAGVSGFFLAPAPALSGVVAGCFFPASFFGFSIDAAGFAADPFASVLTFTGVFAAFGAATAFAFLSTAVFFAAGLGAENFFSGFDAAFLGAGLATAALAAFAGFDFALATGAALRVAFAGGLTRLPEVLEPLAFAFPWPFAAALVAISFSLQPARSPAQPAAGRKGADSSLR